MMEGTTRYFDPEVGKKIVGSMEQVIKGICDSRGADYEFEYRDTYIPTVNDPQMLEMGRTTVEKYLPTAGWQYKEEPVMGAEDFSFYLEKYPGAMFFMGIGEDRAPLHNPCFNFNDDALKYGILFFVYLTLSSCYLIYKPPARRRKYIVTCLIYLNIINNITITIHTFINIQNICHPK